MASSLILQGGVASTRTISESIAQASHGFAVGDVVRWDTVARGFTYARADSAVNAEVVGVVNLVTDSNNFELTYSGVVDLTPLSGLSASPVLFLSAVKGGSLDVMPPSTIGSVVKPVLTKVRANSYVLNNFLGTQIGGSSTVAIDEIQPVGTIMPFAGSVIPDTWLACNGATYNRVEYPELYTKLCFTDGDQVPMYGYVVGVTGAAYTGIEKNDIIHFKNSSTSPWQGSGPYDQGSNDDIRAVVVALPTASVRYLQLSVIPKYTGGRFTYQNAILKTGNAANANANYRIWQANGAVRTATSFTVTEVAMLHFRTPDLRGRFALGSNSVGLSDNAIEPDPLFISSLGTYAMGSLGGEESHTLSMSEMASHSHDIGTISLGLSGSHRHYFVTDDNGGGRAEVRNYGVNQLASFGFGGAEGGGTLYLYETNEAGAHRHTISGSVAATGTNSPHNNMPPYTTVLYIIKAKPYTRAAIIEGVDIPYSSLLVRDLRSRNVGGSDSDLIICTNTAGDSGVGTERIRVLGTNGRVGIAKTAPIAEFDVNGTGIFTKVGVGVSTVPTVALDVNGTAAFNVVGIGTRTPASGVALDIVGEARSSISTTATSNAKTLVTKDYVDTLGGLGIGQTWQTFVIGTSPNQRYSGTNYTNSSGKPIQVFVHTNVSSGITIKVGGVTIMSMNSGANLQFTNTFIVPNNTTYSVFTGTGSSNAPNQLYGWAELR